MDIVLSTRCCVLAGVILTTVSTPVRAGDVDRRLRAQHWFDLERVSETQISPDGTQIAYVRRFADIMTDRSYTNLWLVRSDGSDHRPLTTGRFSDSLPRWSNDGTRIAFVTDREGGSQIYVRYMDTGQLVRVTNTPKPPSELAWSPDDRTIAFTMPVPAEPTKGVEMPFKPEGAQWAEPPVVIDKLNYRFDKRGYLKHEYSHVFVVPSLGGTPRQLTDGDYHHRTPAWSRDGARIYFSGIRKPDAEWIVQDTEVYSVALDGEVAALTARVGPDEGPVVSPDGSLIAYLGFDENNAAYTNVRLCVMGADGSAPRALTADLDRSAASPCWAPDGREVYFLSEDEGRTHVFAAGLDGRVRRMTEGMVRLSDLSVSRTGRLAAVLSDPRTPSDVATLTPSEPALRRLTEVNEDLLGHRETGEVEEVWYASSHDGRRVQGWIIKPPGFDAAKKYPLVLYIHGGPHAMYGVNFQFEFQVHAADDQVVFYSNPRGSTGYGEEFGNIIQYRYPGDDYYDLMSGVDELIGRGYVDEQNLFVTGGSGGGVLTCWLIGRTDRFAAAVSQYPVINWYSFLLTCDIMPYVRLRWFDRAPWDDPQHYMERSPISLVGNVTTPCLLITGTEDWRTPISETEQYYQALKLQKKETKMVRVPEEAHGVAARPSHYVAKILHIRKWFSEHKRGEAEAASQPAATQPDAGS